MQDFKKLKCKANPHQANIKILNEGLLLLFVYDLALLCNEKVISKQPWFQSSTAMVFFLLSMFMWVDKGVQKH